MRIAFTIIYDGLHHLKHNGFTEFMLMNFDYWVVVEGHARAGGSTSWCKNLGLPQRSQDGTHEYLMHIAASNPKLKYFSKGTYWNSKDQMVNKAIEIIKNLTTKCYLWQVDVDEQYSPCDLPKAEIALDKSGLIAGSFKFFHYLCPNIAGQLVAKGEWGDGSNIRIWKWEGQNFISHEPPIIEDQTEVAELPIKYHHYSYFFEKDVRFKDSYYGYPNLLRNWLKLKSYTGSFPAPINLLFGNNRKIPKKSFIEIHTQ